MRKNITKLLGWKSENTYYDWKKQNRPILKLLEKYFTDEEINEFLTSGKIEKLEKEENNENENSLTRTLLIDNSLYTVKEKIKNRLHGTYRVKEIIIEACKSIKNEENNIEYLNAKQRLIDTIKGIEIEINMIIKIKTPKKTEDIFNWIKYNISEIEAHTLINNYENIFNSIEKEKIDKKLLF